MMSVKAGAGSMCQQSSVFQIIITKLSEILMNVTTVATQPIEGQKPGTSGLRKKTRQFMEPNYLENFVQSIFNATGGIDGKTLVLGGDGRFFNKDAIQTIIKMAAASNAAHLIVGQQGILSTPAASHLIRINNADGGIILSASHNPGGVDEDFGVKFNGSNGGPANETITDAIYHSTTSIDSYDILEAGDTDISSTGVQSVGNLKLTIVDPVSSYLTLMESLFDFDAIRALFGSGFTVLFDAMHAVTGPYAKAILEESLGAPRGSVINGVPLEDFGGGHPDPNPIWAKTLVDQMMSAQAPNFGAASDGDGDRNMIVGRGIYVTPSDSLAVMAANAHLAPGYAEGLVGIARSMPTSGACDKVAEQLGIASFETPTGWKFFGNLLDADLATICGEESAGTGSNHVREKDGLWAVLLWLNVLAARKQSVAEIMREHWAKFGRNYYSRYDYEALPVEKANMVMDTLNASIGTIVGNSYAGIQITQADQYSYDDPVDKSVSENQGLRVWFEGGRRAVLRLSGTGTEGATLRLYLEDYCEDPDRLELDTAEVLQPLVAAILELIRLEEFTGRTAPDVVT